MCVCVVVYVCVCGSVCGVCGSVYGVCGVFQDSIQILHSFPCRVRVSRDTSMFATFSSDSTVKLWDATKLDQQPFILKAKYTQKSGMLCVCMYPGTYGRVVYV